MSESEKIGIKEAAADDDKASKSSSSEATAPQTSPRKTGFNSDFHHHVVPTEKSGALNVYIQVCWNFTGFYLPCLIYVGTAYLL